jgi:hypothetical protein
MPVANYTFVEVSPAAPGTIASSQLVSGGIDNGIANGICGLIGDYDGADIIADLLGATGGSLDVYVQLSPDEGTNWYDIIHYPTLAAGAAAVSYHTPVSLSTFTSTCAVVGKNLSPKLSAGTVINGAFTDRLRLVMVAGASTSAGAAVVVRVCPQRSRIRETGE